MAERRKMEIPEEVARAEAVPEDLDSSQLAPYTVPSTLRRRKAAWVYLAAAGLAAWAAIGLAAGYWIIVALFVALATWHLAGAWPIRVLDPEALETANRATEFPVGHASAAIGFDGPRSRPVWNVLVFSADEPPSQRGLVRVDAVDGKVIETYVEAVPAP